MAVKAGAPRAPKVDGRGVSKGTRTSKLKPPSQRTVNKTRIPKSRHQVRRRTSPKAKLGTTSKKSTSNKYLRQKAVKLARKQEMDLVRKTGKGTRPWTPRQREQLKKGRWIKGYEGHHIRDVSSHSKKWSSDPRNIKFVTRRQHLREHKGDFKKPTTGKLIDRQKLARQATVKRRRPKKE